MGVITVDTIALVDQYPQEDERVVAQQISRAGGGPAAVAAVALSRLGIRSAIIGTIGDDADGKEVLRIFEKEGVDTSGVSIGDTSTAGSVIVASKKNNTRAISTRQPVTQVPLNESAKKMISASEWLHVDHVGVTRLNEAGITRGKGPQISFDAGYGVEDFDPSLVDLFVPTDRQMSLRYPGVSLSVALENDSTKSGNTVVATQGSAGSSGYSSETGLVSASGFKVEVTSTLGAGDVFHGAIIAQIIQGFELSQALRRANAVAALSCRGLDGQSMIPTTAELNAFLESNK
ncbi:MAG: carbohydrate kinase family protein [Actinobacteria bacterium]|jgi:sulfofructose kinase|nr:carbohydrate kinase family protein [Actinomycetota bacterium]NCV82373.1 carbohydrate kinase family protein [Actinomycetota bacterium]NCW43603.1 carbohydrate kinase family protein [Actinomycetota bacterium]NCW72624.1 carbohydrate kinase family protein [Actinomycetota bacterium]NCW92187.1 carbohydrate kinase family protein [Actinomycetota bacterium]